MKAIKAIAPLDDIAPDCYGCPLCNDESDRCCLTGRDVGDRYKTGKRPDDCPIMEVEIQVGDTLIIKSVNVDAFEKGVRA